MELVFGGHGFRLECAGFKIEKDEFIAPFEKEGFTSDASVISLCEEDMAFLSSAEVLSKNPVSELLRLPSGRLFLANHWGRLAHAWGFYPDELNDPSGRLTVWVSPELGAQPKVSATRFLSTAGLHGLLLRKGCPIIHASFIEYKNRAIVFTAPSGTGKSTQADLWKNHVNATVINGDRVLLSKKNGVWHACGYPCCGSSRICLSRDIPLGAVVVLSQAATDRVRELSVSEKLRALVSATEVYPWDSTEVDLAFALAEEISSAVPVLGLACTPRESAVQTLRNYLEDEKHGICF